MSLLNDEAIKIMLVQPDILSEEGKIQSVWDMFTTDIKYQEDANTTLKVILKCTDGNVIRHLLFGDGDCLTRINRYHNMVSDVKRLGVSTNNLTNFMYALDNSLIDYISIKDNSEANIQFNMGGNFDDPSYHDQSVILSAMVKNGLINSDEIQSLLDDQNNDLVAAVDRCLSICSRGESPSSDRGRGIRKASQLSLNDFGTCTEKIINCIESLLDSDVDLFPNSPSDLEQMIFPISDFNVHSIFRQGTYIPNLANYGIMSTSLQYMKDSFELDNNTAIYQLSSLMNHLKRFMDYFNKSVCLFNYMVAGAMIIRYLKTKSFGKTPDAVLKIYKIKQNIANAYSAFMSLDETEPNNISDMVRIPEELEDFVKSTRNETLIDSIFNEDDSNVYDDAKETLNDILSDIEKVKLTLEEGYNIKVSEDTTDGILNTPSALSPLVETSVDGQAQDNDILVFSKTVTKFASNFHSELNRSLLEGNFEEAANQIALEVALLERIDNRLINSTDIKSVTESIERDIMTYREKINASSTGISSYQQSAKTYVESLFG